MKWLKDNIPCGHSKSHFQMAFVDKGKSSSCNVMWKSKKLYLGTLGDLNQFLLSKWTFPMNEVKTLYICAKMINFYWAIDKYGSLALEVKNHRTGGLEVRVPSKLWARLEPSFPIWKLSWVSALEWSPWDSELWSDPGHSSCHQERLTMVHITLPASLDQPWPPIVSCHFIGLFWVSNSWATPCCCCVKRSLDLSIN